jgi:hypothetical protein
LKEEALDRIKWRNRFGRGFGPIVWQITDDDVHDSTQTFYLLRNQGGHLPLRILPFNKFNSISTSFHKEHYTYGTTNFRMYICGRDSLNNPSPNRQINLAQTRRYEPLLPLYFLTSCDQQYKRAYRLKVLKCC